MIIDSHCHLNMKEFDQDLDNVILNAKQNNIKGMLTISTNLEEIKNIKKISERFSNIWFSLGIHPNNVDKNYLNLNAVILPLYQVYVLRKNFLYVEIHQLFL